MGELVRMQRWVAGCDPSNLKFDNILLWLQIHRLPIQLMNREVAQGVAKVAGTVHLREQQESETLKLRFFRVRAEIDTTKPLITRCFLERGGKPPRWIAFNYERLPRTVCTCGILDHESKGCGILDIKGLICKGLSAENDFFAGSDGLEITEKIDEQESYRRR